jgi:ATP-binding cassette subfamily B protein RaxB
MDLDTLRRRYAVSLKGATLKDLTEIAGAAGLATRALRLELSELGKLRTPCILHWSLNHFVVLSRVHGRSIIIHDPARGKRRISLEEASREFTGVALEAVPTKTFTQKKEPSLGFGYLLGSLGDLGGAAATVILLSICLEIVALLMPIGGQVVIDEVITSYDYDLLLVVAVGISLLLVVQVVVEVARGWTLAVVQTSIGLHWNSSLFDQLMRLPLEYFAKRHVGDVISRFGSLGIVQKALTTDVILSLFDGVMSIGMLIMLFLYGGWLGGIALVSTGLNALFHASVYRPYRQSTEEAIIHDARQQTHFIETLRGIASVKLLGLTKRRRAAWINHLVDSLNAKFHLMRLDLIFGRANGLLAGADRIVLLVLGARMVMSGTMSLGMLVAFLAYRDQFAARVISLIGTGFQLQMLGLQLTRLADIVLAEPEQEVGRATEMSATSSIELLGQALRAENVSFRYGDNEPWVFRNISLDISPGTCVAITGPSGCGKTTFLKILMGLNRPTEGVISYGGINVNALGNASYRERIAGVLQDDGLFAGSLGENICGFDDHPDPEWMTECADRAAILDDIRQMPMGFETLVGDMGSTLSGGQKQRVILARALYRRPAILFLDEATSHLDQDTEALVAEALRGLRITRVIVAHRPATIAHADRVIRLDSFEESRLSSVGLTAGEAIQPSHTPGALPTMRDQTRPLGPGWFGKPKDKSRYQAETATDDAETPSLENIGVEPPDFVEETAPLSFSAPKLRISTVASKRGYGAQPTKIKEEERGRIEKVSPRGMKETNQSAAEAAVVDADVSRPENIRAQGQSRVDDVLQRRFLTGKLKTSALALAGTAIVVAVPTLLHAPRNENVATSNDTRPPVSQTVPESLDVSTVDSKPQVDLTAKAPLNDAPARSSGAKAVDATRVPDGASNSHATILATPDNSSTLHFPDPKPIATGSSDSAPLDETSIATESPAPEDRAEAASVGGAPVAPLGFPAPAVTSGASGAASVSPDGAEAGPPQADGAGNSIVPAPPSAQYPIATAPASGSAAPFTNAAAPVTSALSVSAIASPEGVASSATQPAQGDLSAPPRDEPTVKGPFADGATIPAARPAEIDSPGTAASMSLDGAPALLVASPAPQFPGPVSTVSRTLGETPIATKVPVASVPASRATQPAVDDPPAPQGETQMEVLSATDSDKGKFADGAPMPPVRPAEMATDDSPGTEKTSVRKPGRLSRYRREALSPDRGAGTAASAAKDRLSRYPPVRIRANADSASRASKDRRNALERPPDGPEAPNASGKLGDPLLLIGSVPSPGVGSPEAPAPAPIPAPTQQPADH